MARKASTKVPAYNAHSAVVDPPSGTDLLQRLVYEHRAIRKLWEEMQRAHIRERGQGHAVDDARLGDTSQADLAPQIVQALAEHEALELEFLYPAAAKAMNDDWADHARAEHADVRDLLLSIEVEDPADEGIFDTFSVALTRIVAHMDEEDKVLFPILRMVMAPADLMIDSHSSPGVKTLPPAPKVIDLAGAERELTTGAEQHGDGDGDGSGEVHADVQGSGERHGNGDGTGRSRRLLRRR